ncbi:aminotransferase-like domain-containing protein [Stutzerimonas kunmingensis]|uniref:aminotransferase-like domain-containing protein n=2 Tax=Pseudomonadota TaxID=1224 RepID=UPI0028A8CADD|nr:PLP-dependent aminotransferase family protein [Stutzerimonas kunmingensis]
MLWIRRHKMKNEKVLYRALAGKFAEAIDQGLLPPGSRLPSVRTCSVQHGTALNTVTAAYRLLEAMGLVEARHKSGYFVRSRLPSLQRSLQEKPVDFQKAESADDLVSLMLRHQGQEGVVDTALACPSGEALYPGAKLSRLTCRLLRRRPYHTDRYALPPGSSLLREEIARRGLRLGMELSADNVIITHGAMEALQLSLRAVTRPGDTVGVESPTFFNLYPLMQGLGLNILEIPTHPEGGISLDALESLLVQNRLAAIVAMPTVHNPLGFSMSVCAKRRLAQMVNSYQIPLIEDIIYAELQYSEPLQPTVKAFDHGGWVIVCSSYTKTLAPDYRIGWLEAGRFHNALRRIKFASSVAESTLLSEAVGLFLASGDYDVHLRSLRRRYALQTEAVRGAVARYFPKGTHATRPTGGFLLWVELPETVDSHELFHKALKEKILIVPGQMYSNGSRFARCLRLSCCQPVDEHFLSGVKRLGTIASELADAAKCYS